MRASRLAFAVPALALAAIVGLRLASAGDDKPAAGGMMPQKPLKHPFIDCMLGSWTTESEADFTGTGTKVKGKGKVTFSMGVGGTALLETYENSMGMMDFHGHAIYKVSDDGKTLSCWWIDSMSAEPMKISGPVTDKGCDITSPTPEGTFRIKMDKTTTGLSFHMYMGEKENMSETYTPAPK